MISIIIPYIKRRGSEEQLERCLESIRAQTYQDWEILIVEEGSATHNINEGVKRASGEFIKLIGMDDHFTKKTSLKTIVDAFKGVWVINGVSNNVKPYYTGDILSGNNKLGGISSIAFRKDSFIPMDESLIWLFDCKWHFEMYEKYGEPIIVEGDIITIEEGEGQATNSIKRKQKLSEVLRLQK